MFLTRSRIWRLVFFAAGFTCLIVARVSDKQMMAFAFHIASGVFFGMVVALWYRSNHQNRVL
jgi:hypothetical protein